MSNNIEIHAWWHAAHDIPHLSRKFFTIMSLLLGSPPSGMQCDIGKHTCSLCNEHVKPDAYHCLFACDSLRDIRQKSMERIRLSMPSGMQIDFDKMKSSQKLNFLLSGFNIKYTREWRILYENVARGVSDIYSKRTSLIDIINTD